MAITIGGKTPETIFIENKEVEQIVVNNDIVWQKTQPVVLPYFYIENAANEQNRIRLMKFGTPTTGTTLEYSTDKITWSSAISGSTYFEIYLNSLNDRVYFRSTDGFSKDSNNYYYISSVQRNINVGGDLRTLLDYTDLNLDTASDYCFYKLFNNIALRDISNLDFSGITTLAQYCYSSMFEGCYSLTTAPTLPATTLAEGCYSRMFYGCTSLTTAPALPATTLATRCYQYMFYGCSVLTTAPALPATTLADYCYFLMFSNCTSLTTAPALPATTLTDYCYQDMFLGCTALTTAPTLPATTLASSCYSSMFEGCNSLTTAPTLPATTLASSCYSRMFYGCTSLTQAPTELPATTLAIRCYSSMFYGCTSLTTSPIIKGIDPTNYSFCYNYMFQNCSSLNTITIYAARWNTNYASSWVDGVAATGDFYNLGGATMSTGTSAIPSGWTLHTSL